MEIFSILKEKLMEQLDTLWESSDEEVLDLIDELLLTEGRNYGLSLNQKMQLQKELFRSVRKLDVLQELLEDRKSFLRIKICVTKHFFDLRTFYYISMSIIFLFDCVRKIFSYQNILREEFLLKDNRLFFRMIQ